VRATESGTQYHHAVETRASAIAGQGLFATEPLPAGTVVLRLATTDTGRVDRLGTGFPNHACDPNLGWAGPRVLATMADVPAGAELVTDYALSTTDADWVLRCHCPSYRCRQMVEGTDWQIPQLQRRYDGWFAPDLRGLVDRSRPRPG
jgi:uncharacterized protein